MKKILLQAGHGGRRLGAIGAPGERDWNVETVKQLKEALSGKVEVTTIGGDDWKEAVKYDYDLFLAIHYDADIYNDRGGFVDTPEPYLDYSSIKSKRIARIIREHYFSATGIPEKPERSNRNTREYYMWQHISAKTPCVIIECGVGDRRP